MNVFAPLKRLFDLALAPWRRLQSDAIESSKAENSDDPLQLENVDHHTKRLWNLLVLSCASILIWAAIFPLDIVSIAEGVVETSIGLQKVQHLEGGIVSEILVKEGDHVTKDQPLVRMAPTRSNSDVGEITARMTALKTDLIRLEAEIAGTDTLKYPEDFKKENREIVARAMDLFRARRNNLHAGKETQRKEISQRQQDFAEITARLNNAKSRYQLAIEQVDIGKKLIASNLSNRYEQIEREKEANALKSRIEEDQQALIRAQESVEKARAAMAGIQSKYNEDVRQDLSNTRRQLDELADRQTKFKDVLSRTELRAPMAGTVKTRYVDGVGSVVPSGGTVLDLVPEDSKIIVEAKLQPQDIGYVQVGQRAFIQLASAEASIFGHIGGEVTYISPDSITDKEDRMTYYIVRVSPEKQQFDSRDRHYPLTSGVQITVGIVTGKRSVLEYLLSSLFRTMPFALSER